MIYDEAYDDRPTCSICGAVPADFRSGSVYSCEGCRDPMKVVDFRPFVARSFVGGEAAIAGRARR